MALLRWQWTVANGGVVTAVIDTTSGIERVLQGGRVLSEAPRGTRSEGHTVAVEPEREMDASERPPIEAVVTFDPRAPICILRVDDHEVAPAAWPVRERPASPPPPAWGRYLLSGLLVCTLLVGGILLAARRTSSTVPARPDAQLGGTHRALNGLFVAHHPEDLEAKLAVLPSGVGGVVLEDKPKWTTLVVAALPADPSAAHDPWALQQRLRDEALANVPKGAARFEETSRGEETCLGERGAVVAGQLMHEKKRRARVWSCAFVHEGSGYFVLYTLTEPAGTADEKRARAVLEATELTRLADLGVAPESLPPLDPR